MESQINDNSFIDNENIHNYIKKNKYNLDEINQEIDILDKVYEQIVILNHQISDSNRSIDRLKETNCGKLDIFNGYWKTIFTTYDNLFLNSDGTLLRSTTIPFTFGSDDKIPQSVILVLISAGLIYNV